MSTIATLTSGESGSSSLIDINNNFSALNTDKSEKSNNLSDLTSASTARTNLGLGTASTQSTSAFAQVANNLSDINATTARGNLGLGTMATQAASAVAITGGTITGTSHAPREVTTVSASAPTPNADITDIYTLTALATAPTFGAPTGTPVQGQKFILRIKDNGTARALAYNAIYRASTDIALPTTTQISKTLYLGFIYNATDTKWDLLAKTDGF